MKVPGQNPHDDEKAWNELSNMDPTKAGKIR